MSRDISVSLTFEQIGQIAENTPYLKWFNSIGEQIIPNYFSEKLNIVQ